MSINTLSTAVGESSALQLASVMKPSDSTGTELDKQSNVPSLNPMESVLEDKAKDLPTDADSLLQASQQQEVDSSEQAKQGESLIQSLQQMAQNSSQLSPLQVRKLEFSTSTESGRTIVKVIDKENDDVIRQIPSEEFIRVAQKISDLSEQMNAAQGVLFDSKV